MSEVRRWAHTVTWEGLQISAAYMAINDGGEYVMHADYAALAAELQAARGLLERITTACTLEAYGSSLHDARAFLDAAPQPAPQQGDVRRLREALERAHDVLKIMRKHEDQPNGYKYPVSLWFPAIDAALSASAEGKA